jgi:hypothetical protein
LHQTGLFGSSPGLVYSDVLTLDLVLADM